jgi:hypothetical protein
MGEDDEDIFGGVPIVRRGGVEGHEAG